MPLITDPELPAAKVLAAEGFTLLPLASTPDLRIVLVNLMPVKPDTELDFMRLTGRSQKAVEMVLVDTASHKSTHTPAEHLSRFYTTFDRLDPETLSGIIITGAPLERVKFEDVDYWGEVTGIMDTARRLGIPVLNICWAAYAAMYYRHGIPMSLLGSKLSGVFRHDILRPEHPLLRGIDTGFFVPHSRFATWRPGEIEAIGELEVLAASPATGPYLLCSKLYPEYYITGHGEYAPDTLDKEYRRDLAKGISPHIPDNYYPDDDPSKAPRDLWHETAVRLMCNWLDTL